MPRPRTSCGRRPRRHEPREHQRPVAASSPVQRCSGQRGAAFELGETVGASSASTSGAKPQARAGGASLASTSERYPAAPRRSRGGGRVADVEQPAGEGVELDGRGRRDRGAVAGVDPWSGSNRVHVRSAPAAARRGGGELRAPAVAVASPTSTWSRSPTRAYGRGRVATRAIMSLPLIHATCRTHPAHLVPSAEPAPGAGTKLL